jgi:hypothetical protein
MELVSYMILRINSDCYPKYTSRLFLIMEMPCVPCQGGNKSLYVIQMIQGIKGLEIDMYNCWRLSMKIISSAYQINVKVPKCNCFSHTKRNS